MASLSKTLPKQLPPQIATNASSILEDATRLINRTRTAHQRIIESVSPSNASFETVVLPWAHAENELLLESRLLRFYNAASPGADLREASRKAQCLLDDFAAEVALNEDMFKLIDAVLFLDEQVDPESRYFLRKVHKMFIGNGLKLPSERKRQFVAIQERLNYLVAQFLKNAAEAETSEWLTREELDGLPNETLNGMVQGVGENVGKLQVIVPHPAFRTALRYAKSEETRKRLYISHDRLCPQNVDIFQEVMALRDTAAKLLGFRSHAAFRLEDKMAESPEVVRHFLESLQGHLTSKGNDEVQRYKEVKRDDLRSRGQSFGGHYFVWDQPYCGRLLQQKQHSTDDDKISEYFPLEHVVDGLLGMLQHIFSLRISKITIDRPLWHEDVDILAVWDNEELGGGFLGYLYLDLYHRDGKLKNPTAFSLIPGFTRKDGTRQCPSTALLCSFSRPTSSRPCLLRYDDLKTLFHELGHGIHDLVSRTSYARFHGPDGTSVDFGEAPSQMLENWFDVPSILVNLSKHYSYLSPDFHEAFISRSGCDARPPQHISDDKIARLLSAKKANIALANLNQLALSIIDLKVHGGFEEKSSSIENMNMTATYNRLKREVFPLETPSSLGEGDEWGHGQANFQHVMKEYDAGYYSYLWSKVYSTDMFQEKFKSDPLNRDAGLNYRRLVLEKGGSRPELEILREFLGRQPDTKPFYEALG
ncbi:metallopeptidase MepB [Colletotrichum higginsianum]|nr:metallopeptidase MepB [Colletotrichum higginsianum]